MNVEVIYTGRLLPILTELERDSEDIATKWGEAIGQSLNYAFQSNKRAGILLILESKNDERHLIRVNSIIEHFELPIDVLAIRAWETKTAKGDT